MQCVTERSTCRLRSITQICCGNRHSLPSLLESRCVVYNGDRLLPHRLASEGRHAPEQYAFALHAAGQSTRIAELRPWFETCVRSFTAEERQLLLRFMSGSSRLSADRQLVVLLLCEYDHNNRLPRAASCFSMLKLPSYVSYQDLRTNLLIAVRYGSSGYEYA